MEKEQILLKYRNFIVILLLVVSVSIAVRIPVYASENEEIEQLEMERQRALEMIEGLKSSISSVQKDIDNLTIEKNDIQSYIKSLDGQINILTKEIADNISVISVISVSFSINKKWGEIDTPPILTLI